MMKIEVHRKYRKDGYTIGLLYINGKFLCNTLEDTDRGLTSIMSKEQIAAIKIKGKTAIPTGTYPVIMSYSPRFGKQMPLLCGVKGFEGIRIHSGNTAKDTEGCILCGKNTEVGKVTSSKAWTEVVYDYIRSGLREGVTINIHW
jgi:hypothetical protein